MWGSGPSLWRLRSPPALPWPALPPTCVPASAPAPAPFPPPHWLAGRLQDVPITQILKPLVSLQRPAEGASRWSNHPLTRLAVLAAISGLLVRLYAHAPDKGECRACVRRG